MRSSVSHSSRFHGGEPADLNIPAAAACVSVGELRAAEGLCPLELRAMRMWDGFDMVAGDNVGWLSTARRQRSDPEDRNGFVT